MTEKLISVLAETTGASADGIRLFMGLILSQIFSVVHHFLLSKISDLCVKRILHLLIGIIIGFLVWGVFCLHHVASGLGFLFIFSVMKRSTAAKVNFVYQMGYLLVGYYSNNMSSDYSINWTTSQAILTLKMIGLGFELNEKANYNFPSLLSIMGYTFFIGNYLVGPLDSFDRFESFMEDKLFPKGEHPGLAMGLKRLCHGIFYMIISLMTSSILTSDFLFKEEYSNLPFLSRLLYVTVLGHCGLYKYLGVWCIAESACMYMGYTYNGENKWDGLRNVATMAFHQSTRLQHVIETWNINTSNWCAKHIYKGCKFLGNKYLSMVVTMVFLASWHGIHVGYFICFLQEFLYVFMEKGFSQNSFLNWIGNFLPRPVVKSIGWVYTKVYLSFALVGFELYHIEPIHHVYRSIYYICPVLAIILILSNIFFAKKGHRKEE